MKNISSKKNVFAVISAIFSVYCINAAEKDRIPLDSWADGSSSSSVGDVELEPVKPVLLPAQIFLLSCDIDSYQDEKFLTIPGMVKTIKLLLGKEQQLQQLKEATRTDCLVRGRLDTIVSIRKNVLFIDDIAIWQHIYILLKDFIICSKALFVLIERHPATYTSLLMEYIRNIKQCVENPDYQETRSESKVYKRYMIVLQLCMALFSDVYYQSMISEAETNQELKVIVGFLAKQRLTSLTEFYLDHIYR